MMQWCRAQRIRDPCTLVNESKMVNESAFVLEVIPRNLPLFPRHARYRYRYLWDWRIAGPHQKSHGRAEFRCQRWLSEGVTDVVAFIPGANFS